MKYIKTIILISSMLSSTLHAAVMITVDFETPDFSNVTEIGTTYTAGGLDFVSTSLVIIEHDSPLYNDTQSLAAVEEIAPDTFVPGTIELRRAGDEIFSLVTVDLDSAFANQTLDLEIVGGYENGEEIQQLWSSDTVKGFQSVTLDQETVTGTGQYTGFSDLMYVRISPTNERYWHMDNVSFTIVPEPASGSLLLGGLAAICMLTRRRSSLKRNAEQGVAPNA